MTKFFFVKNSCILGKKAQCEGFLPGHIGVHNDPNSLSPLPACSNLSGRGHRIQAAFLWWFLSEALQVYSRAKVSFSLVHVLHIGETKAQQSSTII